ncbi:ATP-binding response regulator [Calothrix sp. 336/3]|uniref:ATP-binding response regulator n=1 Tax=Calothrix sp. 336/3 TaxID=1337936 RepID=UPI0004E2A4FD|nr:hybrid sensor histidine kinase/response regulator [Calothrix sp. 336/3]AKG22241.1 chemotaxis protein CheY [Calothrix sp. 336/3]
MLYTQNSPKYRILVVDDTPDNLILLQTILEIEGYEVELTSEGVSAIEKTLQSSPDLILLDVMMPGMDGYEVTRRIRQHPEISYIPILLLTAFHDVSVVEGLDAGADDFIRKPFDQDELLARVRSLIRLKHSLDTQKRLLRQQEDFVSRVTHDLRTPLVAADRMLNLFQQEIFCPISGEMKQAISAMIRSNQNLLEMVNTLLEVHRFEAGKKTLEFSDVNLLEIAQEVVQELSPLTDEKGVALKINTHRLNPDDKTAAIILGDRLELRRVISNLIGNAIKFTDAGSINICLHEVTKPPSNSPYLILEIQDTGYGIAPEEQTKVFERFRQGTNKRAGSGLGLHLTHRIVETHGGTITLTSELGKGSTFTVSLPKPVSPDLQKLQ